METNVVSQEISIVDALLAIYRQQNEGVRKSFLTRVRQEDGLLDMPGLRTREEMMKVSQERMRDIIAGHEQTLSHEETMKMVDKAIAEALWKWDGLTIPLCFIAGRCKEYGLRFIEEQTIVKPEDSFGFFCFWSVRECCGCRMCGCRGISANSTSLLQAFFCKGFLVHSLLRTMKKMSSQHGMNNFFCKFAAENKNISPC